VQVIEIPDFVLTETISFENLLDVDLTRDFPAAE